MRGLETPPRTIMEVFKMLPEGTLAELIQGTIYMSPAPSAKHQQIIGKLYRNLADYLEKKKSGEVMLSPFDVFLDESSNAVQPDLTIVTRQNLHIIREESIHGVPDLLIEVLSRGNPSHDLVRKKELYEKFGVKEYWIINPDTKESIGFSLKDGIYIESGQFTGKIKSIVLNQEFTF